MDDDHVRRVAHKARIELDLTEKAFAGLEAELMAEMFRTSAEQSVKRERLFFAVRALRMAQKALLNAAQADQVANYAQAIAEAGFTSPNP